MSRLLDALDASLRTDISRFGRSEDAQREHQEALAVKGLSRISRCSRPETADLEKGDEIIFSPPVTGEGKKIARVARESLLLDMGNSGNSGKAQEPHRLASSRQREAKRERRETSSLPAASGKPSLPATTSVVIGRLPHPSGVEDFDGWCGAQELSALMRDYPGIVLRQDASGYLVLLFDPRSSMELVDYANGLLGAARSYLEGPGKEFLRNRAEEQWRCRMCGGRSHWINLGGAIICLRCHPPAVPATATRIVKVEE